VHLGWLNDSDPALGPSCLSELAETEGESPEQAGCGGVILMARGCGPKAAELGRPGFYNLPAAHGANKLDFLVYTACTRVQTVSLDPY
jgi:hypothetical protein